MEWQPIETAPRDGTSILVAKAGKWVREASWWDAWYANTSDQGWMPANIDEEYGSYIEPTHWMPLPEPPETAKRR
jgi:alkylation response protein AidB-like acyl-CoA dehydrogenase